MSDVNLSLGFKDAAKSLDIVAKALGAVSKEFLETYTNGTEAIKTISTALATSTKGGTLVPQLQGTINLISKMESAISSATVGQKKWVSANNLSRLSLKDIGDKLVSLTADFKEYQSALAGSRASGSGSESAKIKNLQKDYSILAGEVAEYSAALAANMEIQNLFTEKQLKAAVIAQVFTKRLQELGTATKISPQRFINDLQLLNKALIDGGISSKDYVVQLKEFSKAGGLSENFNLLANTIAGVNNAFKKGVLLPKEYKEVMSSLLNLMGTKAITTPKQMAGALKVLDTAFENGVNAAGKFYNILQRMVTAKLKKGETVEALKMIGGYLEKNRLSAGAFSAQLKRIVPQLQKMKPPKVGTKEFNVFLSTLKSVVLQVEKFNLVSSQKINASGLNNMVAGMNRLAQNTVQAKKHVVSLSRALGTAGEKMYVLAQFYIIRRMLFAVADLARESVRLGIVMEATFTNIGAIMKLTNSQMVEAQGNVKRLGEITGISVEELGKSFTEIARSGLATFSESIKALEQSAYLAKATMGTMDEGVSAVLTTLKAFREEAGKDLPLAIDTITTAINNSRLDLHGFNQGFQYVAAIAGTAGVKLKEVTAALGTLADSGLTAAKAGVYLRSTMAEFLKDSEKMRKFTKALGLSVEDVGIKFTHSLAKSLENVSSKLSSANASFAAFSVMPKRTAQGLAILIGNYAKLQELLRIPVKSETMITLQYQMQSFQASWNVAMNQLRDAFLEIFDSLKPTLLAAVDLMDNFAALAKLTGGLTFKISALALEFILLKKALLALRNVGVALLAMKGVGPVLTNIGLKLGIFAAAEATVAEGAVAAASAVEAAGTTIAGTGTVVTASLGPWGLLIAGVATALTLLYFSLKGNSKSIEELGKNIELNEAKLDNYDRMITKIVRAQKALKTEDLSDLLGVKDFQEMSKALDINVEMLIRSSASTEEAYRSLKKYTELKKEAIKIEKDAAENDYVSKLVSNNTKYLSKFYGALREGFKQTEKQLSIIGGLPGVLIAKQQGVWDEQADKTKKAIDLASKYAETLKVIMHLESTKGKTFQQEMYLAQLKEQSKEMAKTVSLNNTLILQDKKLIGAYDELIKSASGKESIMQNLGNIFGLNFKATDNIEQMTNALKDFYNTPAGRSSGFVAFMNQLKSSDDLLKKLGPDAREVFDIITRSASSTSDAFTETGKVMEVINEKIGSKLMLAQINNLGAGVEKLTSLTQKQRNSLRSSYKAVEKSWISAKTTLEVYSKELEKNANNMKIADTISEGGKIKQKVINYLITAYNAKLNRAATLQQQINSTLQKRMQYEKDAENTLIAELKLKGKLLGDSDSENFALQEKYKSLVASAKAEAIEADRLGHVELSVKKMKEAVDLQKEYVGIFKDGSFDQEKAERGLLKLYKEKAKLELKAAEKTKDREEELRNESKANNKTIDSVKKFIETLNKMDNSKFVNSLKDINAEIETLLGEYKSFSSGKNINVSFESESAAKIAAGITKSIKGNLAKMDIADVAGKVSSAVGQAYGKLITQVGAGLKDSSSGLIDSIKKENIVAKIAADNNYLQKSLSEKVYDVKVNFIAQNNTAQNSVGHFNSGGYLSGFGGGDTIPAFLERGEFVLRKEAVRKYGLSFFETLNKMRLPSIKIPKFSTGGVVNPTSMGTLVFEVGGNSYPVNGGPSVLQALKLELSNIMRRK